MPRAFDIDVGVAGTVTGLHYIPDDPGDRRTTIILAHGAGAPQLSPFMTGMAGGLASRGLDVVTFNFVYMERGRRAPDPKARLELCYQAAIDTTRRLVPSARERIVVGGKSMGGRIASQVVASGGDALGVAGLISLGYPLHPPGRPERRRDAHLPSIDVPMLFVQGSRDAFGSEAELRPVVESCRRSTLHVVPDGDHSLKVRGGDAARNQAVLESVQDTIAAWIADRV